MRGGEVRWEMWSALAGFSAALVALGLGVAPRLHARWRRPKLKVEIGHAEPFVRLTGDPLNRERRLLYLRFKVTNRGRSEARRVRCTLLAVFRHDPIKDGPPWVQVDIDPSALHWVSLPPIRQIVELERRNVNLGVTRETQIIPRQTPSEVELPAKLFDLVDLASLAPAERLVRLVIDDDRQRGFSTDFRVDEPVRLILTVAITAANARAKTVHLDVLASTEGFSVNKCKAPKDSRPGGWYTLERRASEELIALVRDASEPTKGTE